MRRRRARPAGVGKGCRCGTAGGQREIRRALVRRREPLDPDALARLRRFGAALLRGDQPS
ncbi:hypothetical protein HUT19_22025 [Streptomyces sp. NA02950]|uniref:hypothetical protein n=1 Tax=Streptomyces sp. NA02950 TaxID=2742137 RepID=UPI001591598B|nr:hypothetical protein [Streptomyces sp. NA02950]QKV94106.1 hypothetical protein HUT19_22025 [Streptomyces sp. NA02950]